MIAILAKQKERPLPLFLSCIEGLDYPKSSIFLYVRTNNNTDRTEHILREWVERVGPSYAGVEFDAEPVEAPVEQFPPHEWNSTRFRVLGHIRNISLQKTLEHGCDFYFVCDTDNFIRSCTLKELVTLNLPIVAPFLRVTNPTHTYSNFFAKTDAAGFYAGCDEYQWITHRWVRGVAEVPVIHCTYLVRSDVVPELHYLDGSDDWEFAVFCKSAREAGIPQYLDNRQVYGYITFDPESNAAKVNVAGGVSDQIGFARAELEAVDGPKLSETREFIEPDESAEELNRRFTEIYDRGIWGPGSGVGSAPDKTVEYRAFVQQFMARNRVRSVVDLGCGEWQFSQLIDWSGVRYLGVDVVPAMIEKNRRDFGGGNVAFERFESLAKLPRADLLLCKDVLQHLPNKTVKDYLAAFRKKFRFSLITNDEEPAGILNTDIDIGQWRTLRLDREPFRELGATVLSWSVPWAVGGTIKSTFLLYGDSAPPRVAINLRETNTTAEGAALKFLPTRFKELVRTFWVPKSVPPISARSPHDVSIVSAFFDIGRGGWSSEVNGVPVPAWQKRSTDTYLERFDNLARLRDQMVIFTEERFAGAILDIRRQHGLEELTAILVCDDLLGENGQLADLYRSIELTMGSELHGLVHNPGYPEFWNPDYVLLMSLKPVFVCAALDLGLIAHAQIAWVDFGYCRDDQRFDPAVPWQFDCGGRMNIFYVQAPDDRPIFDVIRSGAQYFQGCHLVGPADCWPRFRELMDDAWVSLLACGLVHHDEPSILMAYRAMPELFRANAVDPTDWFVLFRKFRQMGQNASLEGPAADVPPPGSSDPNGAIPLANGLTLETPEVACVTADALTSVITGNGRADVLAAARAFARGGKLVEVGTYQAEFAERLCTDCEPAKLFCVDPYRSYDDYADGMNRVELEMIYRQARERMARFGERVEFIRTFSADAVGQFPEDSLDFVYIDANHAFRFVYEDLCLWYPKVRPGGLICGDDVEDTDEQQRNPEGDVEIAWLRDQQGNMTWGGHYGVLNAVRTFCSQRSLQFYISGNQFLLLKEPRKFEQEPIRVAFGSNEIELDR